mmetsp:Transcript_582/g.976  ORF Transcript_582/g.976 Transcript_582/m.976 type:complete len:80 (+) Transcript_582:766-1005(+)
MSVLFCFKKGQAPTPTDCCNVIQNNDKSGALVRPAITSFSVALRKQASLQALSPAPYPKIRYMSLISAADGTSSVEPGI